MKKDMRNIKENNMKGTESLDFVLSFIKAKAEQEKKDAFKAFLKDLKEEIGSKEANEEVKLMLSL